MEHSGIHRGELHAQSLDGMHHQSAEPQCCCGRTQCAYLVQNRLALEDLEQDVKSAARVGQVRS